MDRYKLYLEVERILDQHTSMGDGERIYVCAEVLMHAFTWGSTPQRDAYWRGIHHELIELADTRGGSSSTPNKPHESTAGVGTIVSVANVISRVEQLLADVKATVEAEPAKPEPARKLAQFMRHALHKLEGREAFGQRGLLEDLKDWS
jgi:hypothetical protein